MPTDQIKQQITKIKKRHSEELKKIAEATGKRPKDILRIADQLNKHLKVFETLAAAQLDPSINTSQNKIQVVAYVRK